MAGDDMVSKLSIRLDAAEAYDAALEESRADGLPECGDLQILVKPRATVGGRSAAMLTWTVDDGGRRRRVQAVVTLRQLVHAMAALRGIVEREDRAN